MTASIASDLSTKRPMTALLTAQFLGAFNDNAWKLIVFTFDFGQNHFHKLNISAKSNLIFSNIG